MRRVYILPNLFTAGNLFCGLLAIFEIIGATGERDISAACQLIFLAGVFDVLDGIVARLTHSESPFGLNFDSLADVISFGAAPAMMTYVLIHPAYPLLSKATCGLFVISAAMRLARFNVQAAREEKRTFRGLPSPGAGCAVASLVWFLELRFADSMATARLLPPTLVLLAYLMVGKVHYFGFKSLRLVKKETFETLISIVIISFMLLTLNDYLDIIAIGGFSLYVLSGPSKLAWTRTRHPSVKRTGRAGRRRRDNKPSDPAAGL